METSGERTPSRTRFLGGLFLFLIVPIAVALFLYKADEFDPAPLPDLSSSFSLPVPVRNGRILKVTEKVGEGLLPGPEDFAYDAEARVLYTGCQDGWIKRVALTESASATVENWVNVGGRPLGLAFGADKQLFVADAYKGLLRVTAEAGVEALTDEAEGVKFRLTDGVDVASDGVIYFTDASHKYDLDEHIFDILEGRPHGRLLSFDPSTNRTLVLARDLYFANGVALSPQHDSIIFCESLLKRCRRYHIQGKKKGTVDKFVEHLPGFPDNIRYDGDGRFWIALASGETLSWKLAQKYPILRKLLGIMAKYGRLPHIMGDGGVVGVSMEGEVLALYTDPDLFGVTCGLKIGRHLYYGSLVKSYISRLDLPERAAT
eukprot:TRINITY_DN10227_c0_g1_i1.p1 TRINITY_DN10227_c0_g1~~TRINITY_DN10227_c0_g1_i1.p1  ORF type:complete len:375 (-),score=5.31 TRINITY_DN10227_c0_g1_i1:301-1425(-)